MAEIVGWKIVTILNWQNATFPKCKQAKQPGAGIIKLMTVIINSATKKLLCLLNPLKVNDNKKDTSLIHYVIYYSRKRFVAQAPGPHHSNLPQKVFLG